MIELELHKPDADGEPGRVVIRIPDRTWVWPLWPHAVLPHVLVRAVVEEELGLRGFLHQVVAGGDAERLWGRGGPEDAVHAEGLALAWQCELRDGDAGPLEARYRTWCAQHRLEPRQWDAGRVRRIGGRLDEWAQRWRGLEPGAHLAHRM